MGVLETVCEVSGEVVLRGKVGGGGGRQGSEGVVKGRHGSNKSGDDGGGFLSFSFLFFITAGHFVERKLWYLWYLGVDTVIICNLSTGFPDSAGVNVIPDPRISCRKLAPWVNNLIRGGVWYFNVRWFEVSVDAISRFLIQTSYRESC